MRYDERRLPRARGFTMIEIMVTLGIILLLVGILIVGITFVGKSSQAKATRVTLANARAMFAELDAKTRLRNQPQNWLWRGEDYVPQPAHATLALNFFTAPYRNDLDTDGFTGDGDGSLEASDGPDALDAPGPVGAETSPINRHASRALLNTQLVMGQLRSIPALRTQLEQLPSEQQMTLLWASGNRTAPGPDGVLNTPDDPATGEDVFYVPGNLVAHDENGDGQLEYFRCKAAHQATTAPRSGSPQWDEQQDMTSATRSAPVLLDAWNNPIIFVPAGGLAVRQNLDQPNPNDPGVSGMNVVIKSPDNRPFWASAGADGNFRDGDDNLYSFEE